MIRTLLILWPLLAAASLLLFWACCRVGALADGRSCTDCGRTTEEGICDGCLNRELN
ncbi:hypothetical protein [Deinococcus hopiensis]|uniref:Uncharacterized protein n=1 Tax=Deinococcus hopiensis KR-140 TaxID=695939 RepID=A0A1W1V7W6_9DEIO|nr:hypothetical protein [Deinococcus hopiensis]SMB89131.1 hypothetical protein SAMN00790413_00281 [Deinococcus hopiensis KR-140]